MQGKLSQTDLSITINRRGGALSHTHNKRREEEKSYTLIFVLAKFSIGSE
jgi:hypothetical protein